MLTAVLITSGGNAIYKRRRHRRRRRRKSYEEIIVWHMHAPLYSRRRSLSADRILSALAARALQ